MSLTVSVTKPNPNTGIHSLTLFRGNYPVYTALVSKGEFILAWNTMWKVDLHGDFRNETTSFSDDPAADIRTFLGPLVGA